MVPPAEPDRTAVEVEAQRTRPQPQTQPVSNAPSQRPHTVGFGGTFGVSNYGGGGSVRYWFGDRVGLNANVSWTRPYGGVRTTTGRTVSSGSVFQALPSVIVNLKKPDPNADIELMPYAGAGLHYITASGPIGYPSRHLVVRSADERHWRPGVWRGRDVVQGSADRRSASRASITGFRCASANAQMIEGFNYLVAVHFYLK